MAKRRITHEEELPFVALMDTMTNVVGVLIIVLVMIGISLASSVKKVLSDLPPVTVEQLEDLLKKVADITPDQDPKKIEEETKKLEQDLKKTNEELKTMDVTSSPVENKGMSLEELNKKLEEGKKKRDAEQAKLTAQLTEAERLKKLLDDTPPPPAPPPATVVKLPNPRGMPENAIVQRFLVQGDKVVYLNELEFMKLATESVEKAQKTLLFESPIKDAFGDVIMVDVKGKKEPKQFLDQKKIQAHFAKLRIGTKDIKMELVGTPTSSRMQLRLSIAEGGGENLATITNPASVFQRAMRKFKSDANTVVWFVVAKDAIGTYLACRDIADQIGVPCGWELVNDPWFQKQITTFEVDHTPQKPAPPNPNAVTIKPPGPSLD